MTKITVTKITVTMLTVTGLHPDVFTGPEVRARLTHAPGLSGEADARKREA